MTTPLPASNPTYKNSIFPNAVDTINNQPDAETADAIMAIQQSLLPGGTPPAGIVGSAGTAGIAVGNGTTAGPRLWGGTGAPAAGLGANGDYYFRSDTPGTANQRVYVKSAGAWVGIV